MHLNYFTLRALAAEWQSDWAGSRIGDIYSQSSDELSLVLVKEGEACTIRCRFSGSFRYLFRAEGKSRARRNVANVFESANGSRLESIEPADRDRHLYFRLAGRRTIQLTLFGPRANAYLVGVDGRVGESFRRCEACHGQPPPPEVPARTTGALDAFATKWNSGSRTASDSVRRLVPVFDDVLAREVLSRAGLDPAGSANVRSIDLERIWENAVALEHELASPSPRIYSQVGGGLAFSLIALRELEGWVEEEFDSTDAAISAFVRRSLSARSLSEKVRPLKEALRRDREKLTASLARMKEELSSGSRADQYEEWGHLLMANAADIPAGAERADLNNLFRPGAVVSIPLDPALSAVNNAERYYDRARKAREAVLHAVRRADGMERRVADLGRALDVLDEVVDATRLKAFEEEFSTLVQAARGSTAKDGSTPFRRFELRGGYEVWVGRNARQNDELTFRHASKHDLWLHARGVAGSHVIMRLPHRDSTPPKESVEKAAQIAAYYSTAAGSELVPVIVTRRKYVRKMKGGPPGAVLVDREEVVIVPPSLPDEAG